MDPNNVTRHTHTEAKMRPDVIGMWVRVEDYWELKNDWIEKNTLINSAIAALKMAKGG